MKKTACFLLVAALLLSFCLSSCGSKEYEISRYTYEGIEVVECIDIDPFSVKPGEIIDCKMITYMDGKLSTSVPCYVVSGYQAHGYEDNPNANDDGETFSIVSAYGQRLLYIYNFKTNSWESPYGEYGSIDIDDITFVK